MLVRSAKVALTRLAALVSLSILSLSAAERPSIAFQNNSGDDAVVRLAGPTSGFVTAPTSASRTVEVAGGAYRIYIKYGTAGKYYYTRGDCLPCIRGRMESIRLR